MQKSTKEIRSSFNYTLIRDEQDKTVTLLSKDKKRILATAKFAFDVADAYGILSSIEVVEDHFDIENSDDQHATCQQRVNFLADQLSDYVRKTSAKDSELFTIIPKKYSEYFDEQESYNNNYDRLMILRTADHNPQYKNALVNSEFADKKVSIISDKNELTEKYLDDIISLLNQAYWRGLEKYQHNRATPEKMLQLINDIDDCYLLTIDDKAVGFVRIHSNGGLGYISDMVIDHSCDHYNQPIYRKKGLGTYLLEHLYDQSIRDRLPFCVLTRAGQGDGLIAAPLLYIKFGFRHSQAERNNQLDSSDKINHNSLGDSVLYMRCMQKFTQKKQIETTNKTASVNNAIQNTL